MKIHIGWPSIEQFRNVVKRVKDQATYHNVPLPKLTFNGSVKLHGTNASIVKNMQTNEMWYQSREQIITPESDNAGFARWASNNIGVVDHLFSIVAKDNDLVAIYGEWCGQGIQKGVAISQLPKMFIIFGVRTVKNEVVKWLSPDQLLDIANQFGETSTSIFSIQEFDTWTIDIDFCHPELIQNKLVELTQNVEDCCPVGKDFGVKGIGEGIVWKCVSDWDNIKTDDLIFKVKGAKHSDTKTKQTATVDIEKVNSINEFAVNVTTDHRLEKMVDSMKQSGFDLDIKNMGTFLKLVGNDVLKEESDVIEASGLEKKEIMPAVNKIAKQWFMTKWNEL